MLAELVVNDKTDENEKRSSLRNGTAGTRAPPVPSRGATPGDARRSKNLGPFTVAMKDLMVTESKAASARKMLAAKQVQLQDAITAHLYTEKRLLTEAEGIRAVGALTSGYRSRRWLLMRQQHARALKAAEEGRFPPGATYLEGVLYPQSSVSDFRFSI